MSKNNNKGYFEDNQANEESRKKLHINPSPQNQPFEPYSENKTEEEELQNINLVSKIMGFDVNRGKSAYNITYLHTAAVNNHVKVVKALIEANANIEARTEDQFKATPLLMAARNGCTETVQVLIEANANIEARAEDQSKATPLLLAASYGHTETVKALIGANANIEARMKDQFKYTPLLIAARDGHTETVQALIGANANIEARTKAQSKVTPLLLAAWNGHTETVKVLLEEGADVGAKSNDPAQKTPLEMAVFGGHNVMERLLKIATEVKSISLMKPSQDIKWDLLNVDKSFIVKKTFQSLLIKNGINSNNLDNYKQNLSRIYSGVMPSDLLESIKKLIDDDIQVFKDKCDVIVPSLLSHLHGISPMPYIDFNDFKTRGYSYAYDEHHKDASTSGTKEHEMYNNFWNNPLNAKYKTPDVSFLEFMQDKSNHLNMSTLLKVLLRADLIDEEILENNQLNKNDAPLVNSFADIRDAILYLNKNTILPNNIKTKLTELIKQYNEYKHDPTGKTLLSLYDTIEAQHATIEAQESKIDRLEKQIKTISQHLGFDADNIADNNHDIHTETELSLAGDNSHSNVYH